MVCIPTTSGTGSEVTPFAVVTDDVTGQKYPLADYALTPTMAIVDPHLVRQAGGGSSRLENGGMGHSTEGVCRLRRAVFRGLHAHHL